MAIQFLCPYCSATITVPNSSDGKRGSCPACRKKLIVPRPPGEAPGNPSGSAEIPLQINSNEEFLSPVSVSDQMPALSGQAAERPPADLVPEPPKSVSASIKKKRRKRSSALMTVGIPVVCFGVFVAVMAAIFWSSQPELKGKLSGAILKEFDLPITRLSLANLELTDDEVDLVGDEFEAHPERFTSSMMKCSVGVEDSNLTITVAPNDGHAWFTVNPETDASLKGWVKKNAEHWDSVRRIQVQNVATDLCHDKLKRAAGDRNVINAARYRDDFALATQVKGFGFLVEAIGQSQRTVCAHEDANGTLYFSLPDDTQSFVLQGRSFDNQPPVFPGTYTVGVAQISPEPPAPED